MSCFIMDARPLYAVAQGIEWILNGGYNGAALEAPPELFHEFEPDKYGWYNAGEIFGKLYRLNAAAYTGRYAHLLTPEEMQDIEIVPEIPEPGTVPQLWTGRKWIGGYWECSPEHWKYLKLLDCLIYQTAEDATDNTPLYKALVKYRNAITSFLARNNAAYAAAEWGEV